MKYLVLVFLLLNSTLASALTLSCEGWSQKPSQNLKKEKLIFAGNDPFFNTEIYTVSFENAKYEVKLDKGLETLYASISFNTKSKIFATMRIPDLKVHNDAFIDFTDDNGDRVSISCAVTE